MTLKPEQIRKLQDVDIAKIDKSKLPDMSRVKLDPRLSKEERLTRILRTAKNPYCFRYGDTAVKLEFADDGPPLQDVMADFLIRQVFDYKKRNGEFIGSYAPYGYVKDPKDNHALLVAEVVKQIFSMFLSGITVRAIVNRLNDHGIMCPSVYKQSQGLKYSCPNGQAKPMWSTITISNMLKNPVYVGDMVQGRNRVKSYKVHKIEAVPEKDWIVVPNTHEPIIDRETFEKAKQLLKRDTRTAPKQNQPHET